MEIVKPYVVGIAGGSGSGKTLFTKKLLDRLPMASLHSLDNYYIDRSKQAKDENGVENFDQLTSIDTDKFTSDLMHLVAGNTLEIKEYAYNNKSKSPRTIQVKPSPILIVEGLFVLYLEDVRKQLDLKIFISAPEHLMLTRRIKRDAEERGYDLADVLYRFEHHVMPSFKKYVEPAALFADIQIPNLISVNKGVEVIYDYLNAQVT
ncbi:MAG: uridine kinase [Bacteroidota bacterium]